MKKIVILTIVALSFVLTGCAKEKNLIEINYDELSEKIKNKDSFVLYVGSSECSHCSEFRPKLEKAISKYKLDVYYINMANVSTAKYNAVKRKIDMMGTPTTVYLKKGKTQVSPRIDGDTDYDTIIDFFKSLKLVKGE